MEVNEGKDGKINTKGAEKKGRQNWKRKGLIEKRNFGNKKKKRRKGGKVKGERTGRINLVPEGKRKIYKREIGGRKGEYQDRDCNYNHLLC